MKSLEKECPCQWAFVTGWVHQLVREAMALCDNKGEADAAPWD